METENLQPKKKGGVRKGAGRKRIDPSLKKVSVVFYVKFKDVEGVREVIRKYLEGLKED